ncbi:MAG: hypothetical protein AAGJ32_08370 [Pseudomonadota bacterium]
MDTTQTAKPDHPADLAAYAADWTILMAVIRAVGELMGPAGNGTIPIFIALRKPLRRALRIAEGMMRRLLLQRARDLVAKDPAPVEQQPYPSAHSGSPGTDPMTGSNLPTRAPERRSSSDPWRFRLHESHSSNGPVNADAQHDGADHPAHLYGRLRDPGDHFGTLRVSVAAEFQRFCNLVVTLDRPHRAIARLVRILRRHRRRGLSSRTAACRIAGRWTPNPNFDDTLNRDIVDAFAGWPGPDPGLP